MESVNEEESNSCSKRFKLDPSLSIQDGCSKQTNETFQPTLEENNSDDSCEYRSYDEKSDDYKFIFEYSDKSDTDEQFGNEFSGNLTHQVKLGNVSTLFDNPLSTVENVDKSQENNSDKFDSQVEFSFDGELQNESENLTEANTSKSEYNDLNEIEELEKVQKSLQRKLQEIIKQKQEKKNNFKNLKNKKKLLKRKNKVSNKQSTNDASDNSDSDIPLDDLDDLLEEGLKESLEKNNVPLHEERKKIVLKKREQDYFEMLPEGWIEVTHFSGMPVYLHKISRVCTLAKPYYLGSGSTRKHEIPISAIPCLAYKKEIEKEKHLLKETSTENKCLNDNIIDKDNNKNELEKSSDKIDSLINLNNDLQSSETKFANSENLETIIIDESIMNSAKPELNIIEDLEISNSKNKLLIDESQNDSVNKGPSFSAKVETVKDNKKERSLSYMQLRKYCEKVFEFQEITIRKFKTWADRRSHMQQRKLAQRPSLPEGTKLITCPLPVNKEQPESSGRNNRKEFVMNPAGKSSVCILHEFVQHAERVQPKYIFKELENANTPYSATVMINSMQYGIGYGSSKKQAKSEAAKATLEILIPDMKEIAQTNKKSEANSNDLSFFDEVKVEDARVSELCAKAGQHSPYQILVECLRRNCGMGDTDITTNVRLVKHQKNEFTMKVGKHVATVTCRNKREGKQRAAQAVLQLLHPQITNWGSLLRLYGRGSCKTPKEKKEEEQKITELQNTACANKPNYAILNKLREEMLKLRKEQPVCPFSGILDNTAHEFLEEECVSEK